MRKLLLTIVLALGMLVAFAGCEEVFIGAAGGAAGVKALTQWQDNLEAKGLELEQRYNDVLMALDEAPDPNEIQALVARMNGIREAQLVNEGALIGVKAMLQLPDADQQGGGKTDVAIAAGIGLIGLAFREFQRRKQVGALSEDKLLLEKKYLSMKIGKTQFTAANPEAAAKLHETIGKVREEIWLT